MFKLKYNENMIAHSVEILKKAHKYAVAYGVEQGYFKIYNGFHTIFTDELFRDLDLLCDNIEGFKSHVFRRGYWKLLYILDNNAKCTYSFMSESTYNRVSKKISGLPHYLQATLIMQNSNKGKLNKYIVSTPTVEDFVNTCNTNNIYEMDVIEDIYSNIYGDLVDEMKQYIHFIVVYKKDYNGIVYVNILLHDSECNKTMKMQIFHRDSDFMYEDIISYKSDKVSIKENIDNSPKVTIKDTANIVSAITK